MSHIIRIIKPLKNLYVLTNGVSETVNHEIKRQEGAFPGMWLGTLGASIDVVITGRGHEAMDYFIKISAYIIIAYKIIAYTICN